MAISSIIPSIIPSKLKQKNKSPTSTSPNNNTTIPHKLQCDSLARLISKRQWDDVLTTLKYLKGHDLICSTKCHEQCKSNHGILHHICCYQPPIQIIKHMLDTYGDKVLYEQDCLGRYPIRACVAYEADYNVIECIFHKNPNAILQKCNKNDNDDNNIGNGNTPLHIAMNGYKQKSFKYRNDYKESESCQEYHMRVIKLFIKELPLSLTISNNNGITPLKLANDLNISLKLNNDDDKTIKRSTSTTVLIKKKNSNRFRQISLDKKFFQKKVKMLFSHHSVVTRRRSIGVDVSATTAGTKISSY